MYDSCNVFWNATYQSKMLTIPTINLNGNVEKKLIVDELTSILSIAK